jgi:replicative DNA helicase
MTLEETILKNLISYEDFTRQVLPYLKPEYFEAEHQRLLFQEIQHHFEKYNKLPTLEVLRVETELLSTDEKTAEALESSLDAVASAKEQSDFQWLMDTTEKWCQERAVYLAMVDALNIIENKNRKDARSTGIIPELLSNALAVSFDPRLGHDYFEDMEERFEKYHDVKERLAFDIDLLNQVTGGGYPRKTLNFAIAGINVGKTMWLCHLAASAIAQGKNVLYLTMEIAEHEIARRIDANLMNVGMGEILKLRKDDFLARGKAVAKKVHGKFIIKEYPSTEADSVRFAALLHELKIKKGFVPDLIIVDYIGITQSSRYKFDGSTYNYGKAVAEELRALAVKFDVPVWSAAQVNRSGFKSTDIDMDNTAESFGLPAFADFIIGIMQDEELADLNQMLFKQIKSRYGDKNILRRFVVGIDKSVQRFYNVEQSAQQDLVRTGTEVGKTVNHEKMTSKVLDKMKKRFEGIKV